MYVQNSVLCAEIFLWLHMDLTVVVVAAAAAVETLAAKHLSDFYVYPSNNVHYCYQLMLLSLSNIADECSSVSNLSIQPMIVVEHL